MINIKRSITTIFSGLTLALAGTAFAGDAAMHMDFYLQDKTPEPVYVVESINLIRKESIQTPVINTFVQQPVVAEQGVNKPLLAKRVFQQRIYSVRLGDTLIKISAKTGVDVLELARLNQIKFKDLDHIQVGQKLKLI